MHTKVNFTYIIAVEDKAIKYKYLLLLIPHCNLQIEFLFFLFVSLQVLLSEEMAERMACARAMLLCKGVCQIIFSKFSRFNLVACR